MYKKRVINIIKEKWVYVVRRGWGHCTMTEGKPNGNKGADELRRRDARGFAQRDVRAMS